VCKPRNLVFTASSTHFSLYPTFNGNCDEFSVITFIAFILYIEEEFVCRKLFTPLREKFVLIVCRNHLIVY
jgi:hypothetical protein